MAQYSARALPHAAYTVALICPLEVEMSAARFMLDDEHASLPRVPHDTNRYILGQLSGHNVVIASLSEGDQGIASAATVAIHVSRTFPSIALRLLVGIAGGIPSSEVDIRLGDVAISVPTGGHNGVVGYTLGKQTPNGFIRKGYLCPPALEWMTVIPRMKSDHRLRSNNVSSYLTAMMQRSNRLDVYQRPSQDKDVLFHSDYIHPLLKRSCAEAGCDDTRIIHRPRRSTPEDPVVHYGLIASGDWVMKDGKQREQISKDLGGAICFETEAAGLMNGFSCLVVRGISDYADSHKNDDWHCYAAATAAGVAKELLTYIDSSRPDVNISQISRSTTIVNEHFQVPRNVHPSFTGRSSLLEEICSALLPRNLDTSRNNLETRPIYVVTGMGGIGKSEVCLKVADMLRNSFWGIFWVDVSDLLNATRDFSTICQIMKLSEKSILSALGALANLKKPWLLILDNADDPDQDLSPFIPAGSYGSVLITSRIPEAVDHATAGSISLEGLPFDEAVNLFSRSSGLNLDRLTEEENTQLRDLVLDLLMCHTLAILQAGAYIRHRYSTLIDYIQLFRRSKRDKETQARQRRALDYFQKREKSRYESVYKTFDISLSFLEKDQGLENSDALCLLNLIAVLSNSELPIKFFQTAWEASRAQHSPGKGLETSNTLVWEHLSLWHQRHLPDFLSMSSSTWDCFRLQDAINKLYNLALLNIGTTHGCDVISMHPLVHTWARLRQQEADRDAAWLQAGSFIGYTWRDESYDEFEGQIIPHIQAFWNRDMTPIFVLGPEAEITVIFLKCALHLWRHGFFVQMNDLVCCVFIRFREILRAPSARLIRFHLLNIEFDTVNWMKGDSIDTLRKVVYILTENRPGHDNLLLHARFKLAEALYYAFNKECIGIMKDVVETAWQRQVRWDQNLLVWQMNLAGLYADDCRFREALKTLEIVHHMRERLSTLDYFQACQMNDVQLAKQILRTTIIAKRWNAHGIIAKVVLPLEDRFPEAKYRSRIWAGRHTFEVDSSRNLDYDSQPQTYHTASTSLLPATVKSTPQFNLLLRTGAYQEAIEHLKTLMSGPSGTIKEGTWWSEQIQMPQMSGFTRFASEVSVNNAFLAKFTFPDRGVDVELDQLRAQEQALVHPRTEISILEQVDPELALEHPYTKYSDEEKARFVLEGRWDKFECPPHLIRAMEAWRDRQLQRAIVPQTDVESAYVSFRRQLANLDRLPDWWYTRP